MTQSTIVITPFGKQFAQKHIRQAFPSLLIKKIHIKRAANKAYVQFSSPKDVESLAAMYGECTVPALGNAEVGLVEAGFVWPKEEEQQGLIDVVEVNRECLVLVRQCDRMHELSDRQIVQIFKKYGISKIVRFEESNEIMIEFQDAGDLETLEINFQDYKVPRLGNNAFIDAGSVVDAEKFVKRYNVVRRKEVETKNKEMARISEEKLTQQKKIEEDKSKIEQKVRERQELEEKQRFVKEENKKKDEEKQKKLETEKQARQEVERKERQRAAREEQMIEKARKVKLQKQAEEQRQEQEKQKLIKEQNEFQRKKEMEREVQIERWRNEAEEKQQQQAQQREKKKFARQEWELKDRLIKQDQTSELPLKVESEPFVPKDYSSKLPSTYILMVLLAWVYYMAIR